MNPTTTDPIPEAADPEARMLSAGFSSPEEVAALAIAVCSHLKTSLELPAEARRRYAIAQTNLETGLLWLEYARKV
jgi:hypothetical protein